MTRLLIHGAMLVVALSACGSERLGVSPPTDSPTQAAAVTIAASPTVVPTPPSSEGGVHGYLAERGIDALGRERIAGLHPAVEDGVVGEPHDRSHANRLAREQDPRGGPSIRETVDHRERLLNNYRGQIDSLRMRQAEVDGRLAVVEAELAALTAGARTNR
jgi:hypothetical protein